METGLPRVHADPTALRQIFDNLISNALKYAPPETTIGVVLTERNRMMRLEVHGQGPGVGPHETERIFVKYARRSARPTAEEKSTGLGLSIVRQTATAMNGRVWRESRPGQGGLFIFVVPLVETPEGKQTADSAPGLAPSCQPEPIAAAQMVGTRRGYDAPAQQLFRGGVRHSRRSG